MLQGMGTGGVSDIKSYLSSRFDLHKKIAVEQVMHEVDPILKALDGGNIGGFLAHLDPQAVFRFGSGEKIKGVEGIERNVREFLAATHSMEHRVHQKFSHKDGIFILGQATYHMKSGKRLCIPFCDVWKINILGKIADYEVYCDPSGLFDAPSPAAQPEAFSHVSPAHGFTELHP